MDNPTEPDSSKPKPSGAEIDRFWREIDFPGYSREYPAVAEYLRQLRPRLVNGSSVFQSFQLPPHSTLDWYLSRNRLQELEFFWRVWHLPTPATKLSALRIAQDCARDEVFTYGSAFSFAGELAQALYRGGAYYSPVGTGDAEMQIAHRAADDLIQRRYSEVLIFVTHAAWCDFFFDVAWDFTWLLVDKRERLFHVLALTDTD